MLALDMLDDVVQATLRFQAELALDGDITVTIMLVDLFLLVLLGTQRLQSLVFV
jgi:hypothetical protein